MSAPVVSPATRADAPGVIALIARVFAEYEFSWNPALEVPDLFGFEEHYQPPYGAFFVVRHDDQIVGSVGVEWIERDTAEIHRLYLDAHLRGRGTGRALVETVFDWCRTQGARHLVLWSDTRFEQSHVLYRRLGFERTGERTVPEDVNQSREYRFERGV